MVTSSGSDQRDGTRIHEARGSTQGPLGPHIPLSQDLVPAGIPLPLIKSALKCSEDNGECWWPGLLTGSKSHNSSEVWEGAGMSLVLLSSPTTKEEEGEGFVGF